MTSLGLEPFDFYLLTPKIKCVTAELCLLNNPAHCVPLAICQCFLLMLLQQAQWLSRVVYLLFLLLPPMKAKHSRQRGRGAVICCHQKGAQSWEKKEESRAWYHPGCNATSVWSTVTVRHCWEHFQSSKRVSQDGFLIARLETGWAASGCINMLAELKSTRL